MNPLDGYSYLAKMYAGWRGEWQFTLPYTAQESSGAYLFMFYLLLGHLARLLDLPVLLIFHLARLLATLCLLWALRSLVVASLPEGRPRLLAYVLLAFGSGMGWLGVLSGAPTSDFWVAEAYPFLAAFANPHFPLSLALLIYLLLPGHQSARPSGVVLRKGLAAFLLANLSPFGAVIAGLVSAILALRAYLQEGRTGGVLRSWARFAAPLGVMVGGVPVLLYQAWVIRSDPLLAGWNAQNQTPAPPWWDLLLSFSPALIFSVLALFASLRRKSRPDPLALTWAVACLALVVIPFALQRRFLLGLYVPLAILAAGWVSGADKVEGAPAQVRGGKKLAAVLLVFLSLPTNLLVLASAFTGILARNPLVYLRQDEAQALEWIATNTAPDALVLASPESGAFIPAFAGRRVFYGHPFETVNAVEEKGRVEAFYRALGQSAEAGELAQQADLVLWGPREQRLADSQVRQLQIPGWRLVYQAGDVAIYQIK
ncbi:MAG: hypothetical protein PHS96_06855 [Anaerolineales bacterium]|nr:hypothetical protein [Anaerolineales bacterium]